MKKLASSFFAWLICVAIIGTSCSFAADVCSVYGAQHQLVGEGYEKDHPHKEYVVCDCGYASYTGGTRSLEGCIECYPIVCSVYGSQHKLSDEGYEKDHPHKEYVVCSCGYAAYTGSTRTMDGCATCYPEEKEPVIPDPHLRDRNTMESVTPNPENDDVVLPWDDESTGNGSSEAGFTIGSETADDSNEAESATPNPQLRDHEGWSEELTGNGGSGTDFTIGSDATDNSGEAESSMPNPELRDHDTTESVTPNPEYDEIVLPWDDVFTGNGSSGTDFTIGSDAESTTPNPENDEVILPDGFFNDQTHTGWSDDLTGNGGSGVEKPDEEATCSHSDYYWRRTSEKEYKILDDAQHRAFYKGIRHCRTCDIDFGNVDPGRYQTSNHEFDENGVCVCGQRLLSDSKLIQEKNTCQHSFESLTYEYIIKHAGQQIQVACLLCDEKVTVQVPERSSISPDIVSKISDSLNLRREHNHAGTTAPGYSSTCIICNPNRYNWDYKLQFDSELTYEEFASKLEGADHPFDSNSTISYGEYYDYIRTTDEFREEYCYAPNGGTWVSDGAYTANGINTLLLDNSFIDACFYAEYVSPAEVQIIETVMGEKVTHNMTESIATWVIEDLIIDKFFGKAKALAGSDATVKEMVEIINKTTDITVVSTKSLLESEISDDDIAKLIKRMEQFPEREGVASEGLDIVAIFSGKTLSSVLTAYDILSASDQSNIYAMAKEASENGYGMKICRYRPLNQTPAFSHDILDMLIANDPGRALKNATSTVSFWIPDEDSGRLYMDNDFLFYGTYNAKPYSEVDLENNKEKQDKSKRSIDEHLVEMQYEYAQEDWYYDAVGAGDKLVFVSPTDTPASTGSYCIVRNSNGANARKEPNPDSEYILHFAPGTRFKILEEKEGTTGTIWYKVDVDGSRYGWISSVAAPKE